MRLAVTRLVSIVIAGAIVGTATGQDRDVAGERDPDELQDLVAAIAAFERAIERDPTSAQPYLTLGDALAGANAIEPAVEAYRQATELDPTDPTAHWSLGRALREAGDLSGAIMELQSAADLNRDNWEVQGDFIDACLDAGRPQAAIAALRARLEAEPYFKDHKLLACLLRYLGDIRGYRQQCRRMLDKYSESGDGRLRHALLSVRLFFPNGGEVTPQLLQIARDHAESRFQIRQRMLGLAYYRLGRDEQALPILERAAAGRFVPDSKIQSLLCLALVQLRMGRLNEARKSIAEARTVQESSPDYVRSMDRHPWGYNPSLWREVKAAMEDAWIEEPIPDLPPTYVEMVLTASGVPAGADR